MPDLWLVDLFCPIKKNSTLHPTIVVNEQTESYKGFIFYLHEEELLYNDVHHSQLTL